MGRNIRVERRLVVSVASAAVLLATVVGCGTQSLEPKDGNEQSESEQQSNHESSDDQTGSGEGGSTDTDAGDNRRIDVGDNASGTDPETAPAVEALMEDYLDALNASTKDGDFSRTEPMIESCNACDGSRETIEPVYRDGGQVRGGLFTDPKIDVGRTAPNGTVTVTVVSTISAYEVIDASGTVVDSGPEESQTNQYGVAERGGEWKIVSGRILG